MTNLSLRLPLLSNSSWPVDLHTGFEHCRFLLCVVADYTFGVKLKFVSIPPLLIRIAMSSSLALTHNFSLWNPSPWFSIPLFPRYCLSVGQQCLTTQQQQKTKGIQAQQQVGHLHKALAQFRWPSLISHFVLVIMK